MDLMKLNSIVFDLDDTICFPNHKATDSYEKYRICPPNRFIIEKMQQMKKDGWHIIISSARRMATHKGNVSAIIADIGRITIEWLEEHDVPYDELHFGKPYSNTYYVDDKAMTLDQFNVWNYNEKN